MSIDILNKLNNSDNYLPLRNYSKTIDASGRITGRTLLLNKVKNLAVIDFDIHDNIDSVREKILNIIPKNNTIVVSTPHRGIHILCRNDINNLLDKNSFVGLFKSHDFNIDIFVGNNPSKQQCLNCPPTKVRFKVDGEDSKKIYEYTFINNDFSFTGELITLSSMMSILADNDIPIPIVKLQNVKDEKAYREETDEFGEVIVDFNLINDTIDGILECEIHNDARPIKDEISLLPLFCALNSLSKIKGINDEYIEDVYQDIYEQGLLTENAINNYFRLKERYSNKNYYCSNYKMLLLMLKYHNRTWYDALKDKYKFSDFMFSSIDVIKQSVKSITFDNIAEDILFDLSNKIFELNKPVKLLMEMRKVIAVVPDKNLYFIRTMGLNDKAFTRICNSSDFKECLRSTIIHFDDGSKTNAFTIFNDNIDLFAYANYKFYSPSPNTLNYFYGYKYDSGVKYDINKISKFLNHIKLVIANGAENHYYEPLNKIIKAPDNVYFYKLNDESGFYEMVDNEDEATHYTYTKDDDFYEYILNWFAYIIQNINDKTRVCILLKSNQGSGKNTFTNVLAEILTGYSEINITSLEDLTSDYNMVLENKKLIICNELGSLIKSKTDFDKLKSIWTDNIFRVGDKYIAKRQAELPINGILLTNHLDVIKIEPSDRRYLCLETSSCMINNAKYFKELYDEIYSDGFYEHLTSFFKNRDIKDFDPTKIPKTNLKESMKLLHKDDVQDFIDNNNSLFATGLPMQTAYNVFSQWCSDNKINTMDKRQFLAILKTRCYASLNKNKQYVWKRLKKN